MFTNSNHDFVQDVSHIFGQDPNKELSAVSHFIAEMEKKPVKKLPDFNKVFDKLKQVNAENKALKNQVESVHQDYTQMRRLNKELAELLASLKAAGLTDAMTADRITTVVRQMKLDEMNKFISFVLNGEEVDLTFCQMKQIVKWYEKGYVYFQKFDEFRVETDKVHLFTFGEIAKYIDRVDATKNQEVVVFGEDPNTVDVCFIADFETDKNLAIRPTHVLKSRIVKKDEENTTLIVDKRKFMTFLLNHGYTNPFNDETVIG